MFPLEEGFGEPWFPKSCAQIVSLILLWRGFGLGGCTLVRAVLEPVAASGYRNHFGVVEQSIKDGAGGRHVAKELSPFLDGAVGGHQGGSVFVATHDDLQEDLAAFGRQDLEPHVVDDKEIGLEIFSQQAALASLSRLSGKLAHQVEHRAVEHQETGLDASIPMA